MKHLALDYFFLRQKVNSNELQVKHIPSVDQLADAYQTIIKATILCHL